MKSFFIRIFILLSMLGFSFASADSNIFNTNTSGTSIFGDNWNTNPYCSSGDCGLGEWIDAVWAGVNGIVTDKSFSQYIQDIVKFLLSFLSVIAVIYIIYAGFTLMIGWGDEEKATNTKKIITYVIIGLVIIWLAGPITTFIFRVLGVG